MFKYLKVTFLILLLTLVGCDSKSKDKSPIKRIAHAGGGINGITYTNSYEALDLNYGLGFRYFEIDFTYTTDQKLICLHDWKKAFKTVFGKESVHGL